MLKMLKLNKNKQKTLKQKYENITVKHNFSIGSVDRREVINPVYTNTAVWYIVCQAMFQSPVFVLVASTLSATDRMDRTS